MTSSEISAATAAWTAQGTELFLSVVSRTTDESLREDSALPGWTRAHVVAHVAANADALTNLVTWARTGEPTPMYASPEDRNRGIDEGAVLAPEKLRAWAEQSSRRLLADVEALTEEQWNVTVVTAQGREIPATEIPWLRCREVFIHSVDLDSGIGWEDLPSDFIQRLLTEVSNWRAMQHQLEGITLHASDSDWQWSSTPIDSAQRITRTSYELASWLTGRLDDNKVDWSDRQLAPLPRWL